MTEDFAEEARDMERVEAALATEFDDTGEDILFATDIAERRFSLGLDLRHFEDQALSRGEGIHEGRVGGAQTFAD